MPVARDAGAARPVTLDEVFRAVLATPSDIREYLPVLWREAAGRPGCRVLELGVRQGNSTVAFLAGAQACGGRVWSCDLAVTVPQAWQDCPWWTFVPGDDTDPAVQARLPAQCDVLFVDTSHEYEHTLAELRAYMPRVAPGGVALFHDTHVIGWPGYEWDRDVPPVWAALDEYCAEAGLQWADLPGRYGLGVIRP